MLKRRDAFLKKSALAVSVALLLSSQALAHKTFTEPSTVLSGLMVAVSHLKK